MLIVYGLLQFQSSVKLYLLLVVLAVALVFFMRVCVRLTRVLVGCCVEFIEGALFKQGLLLQRRIWNQMLRPMKV